MRRLDLATFANDNRGVSLIEWGLLASVVAVGLIASGVYVSRAYQGGLRQSIASISSNSYLPGRTSGTTTTGVVIGRVEKPKKEARGAHTPSVTEVTTEQTTRITRDERINY